MWLRAGHTVGLLGSTSCFGHRAGLQAQRIFLSQTVVTSRRFSALQPLQEPLSRPRPALAAALPTGAPGSCPTDAALGRPEAGVGAVAATAARPAAGARVPPTPAWCQGPGDLPAPGPRTRVGSSERRCRDTPAPRRLCPRARAHAHGRAAGPGAGRCGARRGAADSATGRAAVTRRRPHVPRRDPGGRLRRAERVAGRRTAGAQHTADGLPRGGLCLRPPRAHCPPRHHAATKATVRG